MRPFETARDRDAAETVCFRPSQSAQSGHCLTESESGQSLPGHEFSTRSIRRNAMKHLSTIAVLTALFAGRTDSGHAQESPAPVLPPPVPAAEADAPPVPRIDVQDTAPVPPPVSSPKMMGGKTADGIDPATADEFDKALKSLRMELESVRTLRQERAAGTGSVSVSSALATVTQRKILLNLLQQLATRGPQKRETQQAQRASQANVEATDDADLQLLLDSGQTIDPFALGRALFRIGEYERAEQAFRGVANNGQNEYYLKYLIATCLRKQNKIPEAVALYQQVVQDRDADETLRESSEWQLSNIRWRQNMELQLKRLREVRQGAGGGPVPENGAAGEGNGAAGNGGAAAPAAPGNAL